MIWMILLACGSDDPFEFGGKNKKDTTTEDTAIEPPDTSEEIYENPFECPQTFEKPELQVGSFTKMGAPPGGWITNIQQHPTENNVVWAGSQMNGLYRSLDGGENFEDMDRLISSHIFSTIAVKPSDPNWVGYSNDSLFYSEDQGLSWLRFEGFPNGIVQVHSLMWFNDQLLIVGGNGLNVELFATSDLTSSSLIYTYTPVAQPTDPPHTDHGPAYSSGSKSYDMRLHQNGDSIFLTIAGSAVLRSDNGGSDFSSIFVPQNQAPTSILAHSLAVDASGSETNLALAIYESNNDTTVVYSSDDNGDSWTEVGSIAETFRSISRHDQNISLVNDSGVFILDINTGELSQEGIEYFANEPLSVQYLMDGSLLVGDIRGVSAQTEDGWSNRYDNFLDYDIVTLGSIESCPGLVFAGTLCEMGGFVSYDWGQSWELMDTYFHYVMRLEERKNRPGEIWIISDEQVFKSVSYGRDWTKMMPSELEYHYHGLGLSPWNDNEILIGSVGSGQWNDSSGRVYRSEDGGTTWSESSTGLPNNDDSAHVLHYAQTEEYKGVVLLGGYFGENDHSSMNDAFGLYRSEDHGLSWEKVTITDTVKNIPEIAECNGKIYIATDIGVYDSTDGGQNWNETKLSLDKDHLSEEQSHRNQKAWPFLLFLFSSRSTILLLIWCDPVE